MDELDPFLGRLLQGEPLEYILREAHFFISRFYVNPDVLIPRSETEILVEDALALVEESGYKSFADVGTGSGCVALSLLAEAPSGLEGSALDICPKALEVCSINLFRHRLRIPESSRLDLLLGDRLGPLNKKVDLIVANPPYIDRGRDRGETHFQVDLWEPGAALYLESNEYDLWFEEFFRSAYDKLNPGGALLMEGHENKLAGLKNMAGAYFNGVEVKRDYSGAERFLRAFKPRR